MQQGRKSERKEERSKRLQISETLKTSKQGKVKKNVKVKHQNLFENLLSKGCKGNVYTTLQHHNSSFSVKGVTLGVTQWVFFGGGGGLFCYFFIFFSSEMVKFY